MRVALDAHIVIVNIRTVPIHALTLFYLKRTWKLITMKKSSPS